MYISASTQIAFIAASILSFILCIITLFNIRKQKLYWAFATASLVQGVSFGAISLSNQFDLSSMHLLVCEAAHCVAWILAVRISIRYFCKTDIHPVYTLSILGLSASLLILDIIILLAVPNWSPNATYVGSQLILLTIATLLNVEQLYRNVTSVQLVKILCISLTLMFGYDLYYFSQKLVQPQLHNAFLQFRAILAILGSVFLGIAVLTLPTELNRPVKLSFSRPIVFYTTSLSLAAVVLGAISLAGYYVSNFSGDWGTIAYSVILAAAITSLLVTFTSKGIRDKLAVLINKHLFSHKYDYRTEWLNLIDRLSQPISSDSVDRQALNAVASIFKSEGGALWLKKGKILFPTYQENIQLNIVEAIEPDNSAFIQALEKSEWVFFPDSPDEEGSLSQNNERLPDWALQIENLWLILPLLNESSLIGFMALTHPEGMEDTLDWEDLDLLKTVGKQVANYLQRRNQVEQLAEARQFEAFNKLSAYVMHDLKNLIAQQSLVVKNAEKHKDNPAFVEDTIQTIHGSVSRMNNLLRKLQHNEPASVSILSLHNVILEAVKRCNRSQPEPTIRESAPSIKVKGDQESLTMVFVHIIQNAQDATPSNGFIDISVIENQGNAIIQIEDNGKGMAPEFVRDRLFKPFETTKSGKGMGIGVYQARDYIQNISGSLSVDSTLDEGTCFTITLPVDNS